MRRQLQNMLYTLKIDAAVADVVEMVRDYSSSVLCLCGHFDESVCHSCVNRGIAPTLPPYDFLSFLGFMHVACASQEEASIAPYTSDWTLRQEEHDKLLHALNVEKEILPTSVGLVLCFLLLHPS
jgi:hypothetical protein